MTEDRVDTGERNRKKKYAKPAMERVHLRPEEAVLGSCKTSTVSGPLQGDCFLPIPCPTDGS